MAFTRKFLKALGIEDDKIDTIIEEHTSVTTALTADRDRYKTEADKLPGLQKQLEAAEKASKAEDGAGWKKKYEDLQQQTSAKETRAKKETAYRSLLKAAGVRDKYLDTVIRASGSEIDGLEFDGDKVKDAEKLTKDAKTAWGDFMAAPRLKGARVDTPPAGAGKTYTSRDEIMAITDDNERQQAIADHLDLFQ